MTVLVVYILGINLCAILLLEVSVPKIAGFVILALRCKSSQWWFLVYHGAGFLSNYDGFSSFQFSYCFYFLFPSGCLLDWNARVLIMSRWLLLFCRCVILINRLTKQKLWNRRADAWVLTSCSHLVARGSKNVDTRIWRDLYKELKARFK